MLRTPKDKYGQFISNYTVNGQNFGSLQDRAQLHAINAQYLMQLPRLRNMYNGNRKQYVQNIHHNHDGHYKNINPKMQQSYPKPQHNIQSPPLSSNYSNTSSFYTQNSSINQYSNLIHNQNPRM